MKSGSPSSGHISRQSCSGRSPKSRRISACVPFGMVLAALSAVHVLETMTQLVHVPELTLKRDQEVLNHWSGHIGLHHYSEHRLRGLRISGEGSRLLRSRLQEAHLVARHVPMVSHHDVL